MRCPRLSDLPAPPAGKSGWPWTVESSHIEDPSAGEEGWPKISVVTPSFNQGQFLEETLRSVLLQGYPNLEYIVIDGSSSDSSVGIIRKYEQWITYWVSESDRGQSHAINKGFARATGDIIAFLNSDDVYLCDAFARIAGAWLKDRDVAVIVGGVIATNEESLAISSPAHPILPNAAPLDLTLEDHERWRLPQASGFWSRRILDEAGRFVREDLHYTMDRDLYYRTCARGSVGLIQDPLATYRHHGSSKTVSQVLKAFRESRELLLSYVEGEPATLRRRRLIARWRLGQGHRLYGMRAAGVSDRLLHFLLASFYRPGYLARRHFWGDLLDAVGRLRRPADRY